MTDSRAAAGDVDAAVAAVQRGEPVLVHDAADREGEVDLVYPADAASPDVVSRLRNDAGGLVCVALSRDVAETLELPLLAEAVDHPAASPDELGYGDRSSFSYTVNHRETYTGVTDVDRSRTIRALADVAADPSLAAFTEQFRIPGHVHLLRGARTGLSSRAGHTELGLALAAAAGRPPAVVVCEMLDDDTGEATTPPDARRYAQRHDLVYVEGGAVVERLG